MTTERLIEKASKRLALLKKAEEELPRKLLLFKGHLAASTIFINKDGGFDMSVHYPSGRPDVLRTTANEIKELRSLQADLELAGFISPGPTFSNDASSTQGCAKEEATRAIEVWARLTQGVESKVAIFYPAEYHRDSSDGGE